MRFIMYYSSFETLLTCKFEFFSDTGWANKNYHFSNPFRPFFEKKKKIFPLLLKKIFSTTTFLILAIYVHTAPIDFR